VDAVKGITMFIGLAWFEALRVKMPQDLLHNTESIFDDVRRFIESERYKGAVCIFELDRFTEKHHQKGS
jgi:hypothetical protein